MGSSHETGPRPRSVSALMEMIGEVGAGSILDAYKTGARPSLGVAGPFPRETLTRLFGTEQPTRPLIEQRLENVWELLSRGEAAYVIAFAEGLPAQMCFTGFAVDTVAVDDAEEQLLESGRLRPSPVLAAVVGEGPLTRPELTKRLWGYIKEHGLQDPNERRYINADGLLLPLFGGQPRLAMYEMIAAVERNISKK
jgi:hypothetical protein